MDDDDDGAGVDVDPVAAAPPPLPPVLPPNMLIFNGVAAAWAFFCAEDDTVPGETEDRLRELPEVDDVRLIGVGVTFSPTGVPIDAAPAAEVDAIGVIGAAPDCAIEAACAPAGMLFRSAVEIPVPPAKALPIGIVPSTAAAGKEDVMVAAVGTVAAVVAAAAAAEIDDVAPPPPAVSNDFARFFRFWLSSSPPSLDFLFQDGCRFRVGLAALFLVMTGDDRCR